MYHNATNGTNMTTIDRNNVRIGWEGFFLTMHDVMTKTNDRGDGILGINFRLDRLKMNSGLIAGKTDVFGTKKNCS